MLMPFIYNHISVLFLAPAPFKLLQSTPDLCPSDMFPNLIYTFQPIFTALFAWVLLGETMGPAGIFGGAIIATSVYIVASSNLAESSSLTLATNKEFVANLRTLLQVGFAGGCLGNAL